MLLISRKKLKLHQEKSLVKVKIIGKLEIIVIIQANIEMQHNLRFNVPNKIPVIFHSKELAN